VVHFRSGGEAYRWELEKGGRERQVAVTGALFENDPRVAELAVLTGEVIAFAFEAQMAPHLASGTLETVLDDWCPSFPGFHLYYPSRREVTPALRAFMETLKGGQGQDSAAPWVARSAASRVTAGCPPRRARGPVAPPPRWGAPRTGARGPVP
jgi:DNA-binding transcriptional LysR family regulator